MASSLLILLDDIATVLDDVAAMSKVAARKTAGVLGDDLALNAQQVSGVRADRELPVVWDVAKGSFINKLILVPLALLISWLAPILIVPLLILGGLFLCYEGVEKILHSWQQRKQKHVLVNAEASDGELQLSNENLKVLEKKKIKGAIRTDFILSAEIVVITLGSIAIDASFMTKLGVLSLIALVMTVGVYGLVALIVKIDDIGLYLLENKTGILHKLGQGLLIFAPKLMKFLSIVGTIAMFLVGGGIISHGIPFFHHLSQDAVGYSHHLPAIGQIFGAVVPTLFNFVIGIAAGIVVVLVIHATTFLYARDKVIK